MTIPRKTFDHHDTSRPYCACLSAKFVFDLQGSSTPEPWKHRYSNKVVKFCVDKLLQVGKNAGWDGDYFSIPGSKKVPTNIIQEALERANINDARALEQGLCLFNSSPEKRNSFPCLVFAPSNQEGVQLKQMQSRKHEDSGQLLPLLRILSWVVKTGQGNTEECHWLRSMPDSVEDDLQGSSTPEPWKHQYSRALEQGLCLFNSSPEKRNSFPCLVFAPSNQEGVQLKQMQ
jgi:hypothetical protein